MLIMGVRWSRWEWLAVARVKGHNYFGQWSIRAHRAFSS
uniref:Uncharacterized protein n=1 Tax=Arundo donax TaxID=35708 RepID=A0A0A9ELZ1_ARUDO